MSRIPWNKNIRGYHNVFSEKCKKELRERMTGDNNPAKRLEVREKLRIKKIGNKNGLGNRGGRWFGEKHPRWIKDRTKLAVLSNGEEYRNSPMHREWSRQVKNRDGWKCKISNSDCSGQVVAHHILSWRDYPELRYEVNNGITLCHTHHPRKRNDEVEMIPKLKSLVLSIV